jgi:RimJ/RimL family protein N-acetyltransferase
MRLARAGDPTERNTSMEMRTNSLGQSIGRPVPDWRAPIAPPREPMRGRYCIVEPLDPVRHTSDLHAANLIDREGRNWTYLPYEPFETEAAYRVWVEKAAAGSDPLTQAIIDAATGKAVGVASFMRIDVPHGVIEVGGINYSPLLQRKPAATEAMYLMMKRVFDLGYRRYEWKCDSLNAPSRAAAARLGFSYEGLFRQAWVYKGRNRDTTWFSILDSEWPALREAFERWLAPANFDADGRQRVSLSSLTTPLLKRRNESRVTGDD